MSIKHRNDTAAEEGSKRSLAEAAEWLQRLDNPEVRAKDIQRWLQWFNTLDENRRAFEEMQSLHRKMRDMPPAFRQRMRERLGVRGERRSRVLRESVFRWLRTRPDVLRPVIAATGVLIVGGGAFVLWWQVGAGGRPVAYRAPINQHRSVELGDGSQLVLAADSDATVKLSTTQRTVTIARGAAYFEVHHDARRPFVVLAGGVRVTALGTAFNVQRDESRVNIAVTDGVVEVMSGSTKSLRVAVGQRTTVLDSQVLPAGSTGAAVSTRTARDRSAEFVDAPLSQVLAAIRVNTSAALVIDDPRVADLTYSGMILWDHLDEWVASLPSIYPVRLVRFEDGTIALVGRSEAR